MKIIHFSKTPLAGAPIRLVRALQNYSGYKVNLVDLKRWNLFEHDLVFEEDKENICDLVNKADIIHLHNLLDLNSKDFYPINFNELKKRGKLFIRHFHSHPDIIAERMNTSVKDLLNSRIPSIVIAQFQERFYPDSYVVPNIIPQDDPLYKGNNEKNLWDIYYAPTYERSAWSNRWNTKGMPETLSLLKKIKRKKGYNYKIGKNSTFYETMKEKINSSIIIDELITGSYHLTGIEGLSLSKPVISYLDDRTQFVLREISGSNICPFINVRLEDADEVINNLLINKDLILEVGKTGRKWIENNWMDKKLVKNYIDMYKLLMNNPNNIKRQSSLRLDNSSSKFYSIILPDCIYLSRKNKYKKEINIIKKISIKIKNKIKKIN